MAIEPERLGNKASTTYIIPFSPHTVNQVTNDIRMVCKLKGVFCINRKSTERGLSVKTTLLHFHPDNDYRQKFIVFSWS